MKNTKISYFSDITTEIGKRTIFCIDIAQISQTAPPEIWIYESKKF